MNSLTVPFAKLTMNGSRVSHLCFCLHRIILSEHSHSYTSLILLIAWNLPSYLHSAFCLYSWSNSNVPLIHLTIRNVSGGSYVTMRGWNMGLWSPELLGRAKLDWLIWKGGHQTPLHTMYTYINIYIYIYIYMYI